MSNVIADSLADSLSRALPVVKDTVAQAGRTVRGMADIVNTSKPEIEWSFTLGKIFWSAIIILAAYLLIRIVTKILESLAEKWGHQRLTIKSLIPILRISFWVAAIFFVVKGVLRPSIDSLLAFTASAGIALGFAAQDILKNIFGGIMILLDRPFQVGDKVQVGEFYGEVVNIGLRSVKVVTPDDSLVTIPNSIIVNQSVSNSNSGESNCQVVAEFFLPLDVSIRDARALAERTASISKYVYLKKPMAVVVKNEIHQGRSMFKLRLKAYVLDHRYEFAFITEMTEIFYEEAFKQGLIKSDISAKII